MSLEMRCDFCGEPFKKSEPSAVLAIPHYDIEAQRLAQESFAASPFAIRLQQDQYAIRLDICPACVKGLLTVRLQHLRAVIKEAS
jgi:hypothetical protein